MTVAELIAKLQAMPQDMPVLIFHDDYNLSSPMTEPTVHAVYKRDDSDRPFAFMGDGLWSEAVMKAPLGETTHGDPHDAVLLGWYDT